MADESRAMRENHYKGKSMIPIDHIQITVRDMKAAEPFYDKLMPILGYDLRNKISAV